MLLPSSPISPPLNGTGRATEGFAVVVDPNLKTDPLLEKVCFRISSKLLIGIGMGAACANSFAAQKPVGQILRAVQQARLQKKPGGWARVALDSDWLLPPAGGEELREIVELLKTDVEQATSFFLKKASENGSKAKISIERRPGEDEKAHFRRVTDELKRRKAAPPDQNGRERGK